MQLLASVMRLSTSIIVGFTCLCASSAACGFTVTGTADMTSPSGGDSEDDNDTNKNAPLSASVTEPTSPTADAATAKADAADGSDCDQDGDGHRATRCGGDDCCDTDPSSYPGATTGFRNQPNACGSWDWNCDGATETETPFTGGCNSKCNGEGFLGAVECGAVGRFAECHDRAGYCDQDKEDRVQRCR